MNTLQSWFFIRPLLILLIVCLVWILASVIRAVERRLGHSQTPARADSHGAMTAAEG